MTLSPTPDTRRAPRASALTFALAVAPLLSALVAFLFSGCQATTAPHAPGKQPAHHAEVCMDYESVWAKVHPESLSAGSRAGASPMFRDFYSAAKSEDLDQALNRWQKFTDKYTLPGGDYEDAIHARLSQWCDAELQRCHLLEKGNESAATKIESELKALAVKDSSSGG